MIVVCTGGRDYQNKEMVENVLSMINPTLVIVGEANGADLLVRNWCSYNLVQCEVRAADWDKHGKAAGPIRNKELLDTAGITALVIAFPGGKGTDNCVKQARELSMLVMRVEK